LSHISEAGAAKPDAVFWRLARREGYGSVEDYIEASGEPDTVRERMDQARNRLSANPRAPSLAAHYAGRPSESRRRGARADSPARRRPEAGSQ
jgi:hypothetical protein